MQYATSVHYQADDHAVPPEGDQAVESAPRVPAARLGGVVAVRAVAKR
jgi:hypothetical protein